MQYAIGGVKPSKGIPGLSIERHTWNPNALIIIKMEQVKKEILKTLCSHAKNTKEAYDAFMASYPKEDASEVRRIIRHEFYEIQKTERKSLTNLEEREIKTIVNSVGVDIKFGTNKKYFVRISRKSRMFPVIHNMVIPTKGINYEKQRGKSLQITDVFSGGSIIEVENESGEKFQFTSFDVDLRIGIIVKYSSSNQ